MYLNEFRILHRGNGNHFKTAICLFDGMFYAGRRLMRNMKLLLATIKQKKCKDKPLQNVVFIINQ
jgi:hypothetical protein